MRTTKPQICWPSDSYLDSYNRDMSEDNDALQDAIETGSEISGSAAGAALGLLVAGPPGAIGGAVAAPLITRALAWVATEIRERLTGPREAVRVGAVLSYAVEDIQRRLDAGQQARDDSFLDDYEHSRSAAKELAEGVVFAAQRSYEERKLPFLGRLYSSIAFDEAIDQHEANTLLRLLDEASYHQILLLQAIGLDLLPREDDFRGEGQMRFDLITALTNAKGLFDQGMINIGDNDTMLGLTDFRPGTASLQGFGLKLFVLTRMNEDIDETEVQRIRDVLS